ncbi:lipid phosphate phosphatase 1 [Crassisporium funariophilum]|nr:lipid phosphate phosphatase 1 [Crassisporium funariophilum]
MSRLRTVVNRFFGQDAMEWFDRSYMTDWMVVLVIWLLSGMVSASPVFERDFSPSDPEINHPHKKNQVGSVLNHSIALFVPLLIVALVGGIQRSLLVVHHGAIGVCAARGLARLVTEVLKHSVGQISVFLLHLLHSLTSRHTGRLRPDFLARCKWDAIAEECMGKKQNILDGRKSFPSGHSSTAFSGMVFLSLWIAGQTAAWCFSIPKTPRSLRASRMLTFLLTLLPLFWATHVAVSRLQDYRHHKEDVIVGSFIGIISAVLSYLIFWPSPFSASTFDVYTFGQPRLLYTDGDRRARSTDFELTRLEDDVNAV